MRIMKYYRLDPNSECDVNNLQKILMAAPNYYLLLEGNLPGPNEALESLRELPPGKIENDKYFFGIQHSGKFIGFFDVVRNYPKAKIAFIGLLLFVESEQCKSHGVSSLYISQNIMKCRVSLRKIVLNQIIKVMYNDECLSAMLVV